MPALIPIIDTNLLLKLACSAARSGYRENLISNLWITGRAHPYVGAHVPDEIVEHLPRVAAQTHADPAIADAILRDHVMPRVPVVDLAIRDMLSPRARQIMGDDGDVDDAETMALAELLAPTVILTCDNVFAKFGHASASIVAIEQATAMLRAAGVEATYADGLDVLGFTALLGVHGGAALVQAARRYPLLAGGALAILAVTAWHRKWYRVDHWRSIGRRVITDFLEPAADVANGLALGWTKARNGLIVVETIGEPTLEQRCARYLARCGKSMQPGELRDAFAGKGVRISAAAIRRAMQSHPAFVRLPGDRYQIGRRLKAEE